MAPTQVRTLLEGRRTTGQVIRASSSKTHSERICFANSRSSHVPRLWVTRKMGAIPSTTRHHPSFYNRGTSYILGGRVHCYSKTLYRVVFPVGSNTTYRMCHGVGLHHHWNDDGTRCWGTNLFSVRYDWTCHAIRTVNERNRPMAGWPPAVTGQLSALDGQSFK